uniref:nesprin-2-like n=1 Tax=Pristiophorus japonicus TaxID=55135 RepID=UPI00398EC109
MQNTALRISHWLDAAEEGMCSYSSIPIEEAEQELQHHQQQAETLERVCWELSDQRRVLGQSEVLSAQVWPLALGCLATLQSRLQLLQSARTTQVESLRAGVREVTHYRVGLMQLETVLLEQRTDIQQRLVESAGLSTDQQLQVTQPTNRSTATPIYPAPLT